MRRSILIISLAIVSLSLTGCVPSAYPAFDRPASEKDTLPSEIGEIEIEGVDVDSARYAGTYDGFDIFILRAGTGYCIAVAAGKYSSAACGGGVLTMSAARLFEVQLVPEPARDGDGFVAISENIRVNPNP